MKGLIALLSLFVVLASSDVNAAPPASFASCELVQLSDGPGNFIWKPTGAHFPRNSVIVAEKRFLGDAQTHTRGVNTVRIHRKNGQFIESCRLKSSGFCSGHPECLFASTWLCPHNGAYYRRHFDSLRIKMTLSNNSCVGYRIGRPHLRVD